MRGVTDWLLLRGLSREKRQWGRFPEVFEARIPGARTHRLDLPGVGAARGRPAPATVEAMVEDLRARFRPLRQAAPPAGRWGLLGVSLGGMVTLAWLAAHPEDFAAGVVVNSSAGNLSLPQDRLRLENLPGLLRAARAQDPVARELELLRLTTARHGENRDIAAEWAAYLAERPLERRVLIRQLVAGMRFRAPMRVPAPVLVVSGARDRFVSPRCSDRLAARYGAPHERHPDAGHDLPLDEPEWLSDRLAAFGATSLEAAG
jgi:pimeloyl-ACP methyl ester carboxylesterase